MSQSPNPPSTNNPPANNALSSRLGNRQAANTPQNPAPNRFSSLGATQNQRNWTVQPIHKTVVRFDLKGLGDPFYRLLGHELNPVYGDFKNVSAALERGGEAVRELEALLNKAWEGYCLQGATLVYNWHPEQWKIIAAPPQQPAQENEEDGTSTPTPPPVVFTWLRAIDLQLVLNALARSRSQVLLTRAPLVFSQQYLNRSIICDDPRLVALAKATGYLEEE